MSDAPQPSGTASARPLWNSVAKATNVAGKAIGQRVGPAPIQGPCATFAADPPPPCERHARSPAAAASDRAPRRRTAGTDVL